MGSRYPPGFYDDEDMAALTQAFREVWRTVMADDPFRDFGKDEKMRQTIVQTMIDLVAEHVSSVEDLRDKTLTKIGTHKLATPPATPRRRRRQAA